VGSDAGDHRKGGGEVTHRKLIRRLVAELRRQRRLNLELAERLAAASAVLGRCAERGARPAVEHMEKQRA
jgi:hypothetical protein